MDRGASATGRAVVRAVTAVAVATMFAILLAAEGVAQTSGSTPSAAKGQRKSSPAAPVTKPAPAALGNPCRIYGEGFVNIPGTDTCIKVGGYVRSDAEFNRNR